MRDTDTRMLEEAYCKEGNISLPSSSIGFMGLNGGLKNESYTITLIHYKGKYIPVVKDQKGKELYRGEYYDAHTALDKALARVEGYTQGSEL
jgi:hypothetical protein